MTLPLNLNMLRQALWQHLNEVVRDRSPYLASAGHFYVREYIRQNLAQWGVVQTHEFQWQGRPHQNLILDLPGLADPDAPPVLVAAHYDSVPGSPGADDNATGVVVLLELARYFATHRGNHPIRLVAFDLEESGLVGSTAYATALHQTGQPLRLMLSLEMLGYCDPTPGSQHYPPDLQGYYPDRGNFMALVGDRATRSDLQHLQQQLVAAQVPCEILIVDLAGAVLPEARLSDHSPFWDQNYPALMVTDTSFMRNPHYHQASDRLETLDLEFLTRACSGLAQGLSNLAPTSLGIDP